MSNEIDFIKPTDRSSARTLNRPMKEINEELEATKIILDKLFSALYSGFENDSAKETPGNVIVVQDVYNSFGNNQAIETTKFITDGKTYCKVPFGAFFNLSKKTPFFVVNRPNIEKGEQDIAKNLSFDLDDKYENLTIKYENNKYTCDINYYKYELNKFTKTNTEVNGKNQIELYQAILEKTANSSDVPSQSSLDPTSVGLEKWIEYGEGCNTLVFDFSDQEYKLVKEVVDNQLKINIIENKIWKNVTGNTARITQLSPTELKINGEEVSNDSQMDEKICKALRKIVYYSESENISDENIVRVKSEEDGKYIIGVKNNDDYTGLKLFYKEKTVNEESKISYVDKTSTKDIYTFPDECGKIESWYNLSDRFNNDNSELEKWLTSTRRLICNGGNISEGTKYDNLKKLLKSNTLPDYTKAKIISVTEDNENNVTDFSFDDNITWTIKY